MSRDPYSLPGYDAWKLRSPYDDISPMDEARAEIEEQDRVIETLTRVLNECATIFEDDGSHPELLGRINKALGSI
jgi:hypothetical protein